MEAETLNQEPKLCEWFGVQGVWDLRQSVTGFGCRARVLELRNMSSWFRVPENTVIILSYILKHSFNDDQRKLSPLSSPNAFAHRKIPET